MSTDTLVVEIVMNLKTQQCYKYKKNITNTKYFH